MLWCLDVQEYMAAPTRHTQGEPFTLLSEPAGYIMRCQQGRRSSSTEGQLSRPRWWLQSMYYNINTEVFTKAAASCIRTIQVFLASVLSIGEFQAVSLFLRSVRTRLRCCTRKLRASTQRFGPDSSRTLTDEKRQEEAYLSWTWGSYITMDGQLRGGGLSSLVNRGVIVTEDKTE